MISKHLTILPALAAFLLSTACSNDDMDGILADGPVAAQVTADISDGQTATRTSTDGNTASFTEGDVINVVANEAATYEYTKQSDDSWSASNPYYFQNSNDVSFQGWYSTTAASGNSISIDTKTQTTNDNGWNEWDILATPVVTTNVSSPTVNFTGTNAFKHVMSQATFTFTAGDGISDLSALTGYTLSGLTTDATFNTLTCELEPGSTTGSISPTVTGASGTEVASTIILVPQEISSDLTLEVTYNGQTYTTALALPDEATALATATHYAFNVTIANTGLTVESAEITSWTTQEAETSSASLKDYVVTTAADGTQTYIVYTEAGLLAWSEYTRSGNWSTNCILANDITLAEEWTAVGNFNSFDDYNIYTGIFDGNGYTITNLTISTSSGSPGLIGYLGGAGVVKNLTLKEVNVSSTGIDTGAVVGLNYSGTVTNCSVSGSVSGPVSGSYYTGGVVGTNESGSVTACYFTGEVTGSYYTGGVVGINVDGTVANCSVSGSVTGAWFTGGVVGENGFGTITHCTFSGSVTGSNNYTGGVVGYNYTSGAVTACRFTGNITGNGFYTGGVVGINLGAVTACYSTGAVTGNDTYTGGVVGLNSEGTITACYATGSVTSTGDATGGVVGANESGSVTTCYWNSTTSDSKATYVDGTDVTWADAATEMNKELTDWMYVENEDSTDPPLLLVESTTTE